MSVEIKSNNKGLPSIARQLAAAQSNSEAGQSLPPDFRSVVDVTTRLRNILFDRFSESRPIADSLDISMSIQLEEAKKLLAELITRCHAAQCEDERVAHPIGNATQLAEEFLGALPQIRESLMTDVQAAYDGDPACCNTDEVILCYPGFTAILVYRLAHQFHLMKIPLLPRMMSEWVHGETGIDIHHQ